MRNIVSNKVYVGRRAIVAGLAVALCASPIALAGCDSDDSASGSASAGSAVETEQTAEEEPEAEEAESTIDLAVGTAAELDSGLTVTVDSVDTSLVNYDGSAVVGVHVSYTNNSDETASYDAYDWKGEDANGAQEYSIYYSETTDELGSGSLAAGGSVSGNLYFKEGTQKLLYYGNVLDDEPVASWQLS